MKVICTVEKPCYHPASGLLLEPGEMDVSEAAAAILEKVGYARPAEKKGKARKPARSEED